MQSIAGEINADSEVGTVNPSQPGRLHNLAHGSLRSSWWRASESARASRREVHRLFPSCCGKPSSARRNSALAAQNWRQQHKPMRPIHQGTREEGHTAKCEAECKTRSVRPPVFFCPPNRVCRSWRSIASVLLAHFHPIARRFFGWDGRVSVHSALQRRVACIFARCGRGYAERGLSHSHSWL